MPTQSLIVNWLVYNCLDYPVLGLAVSSVCFSCLLFDTSRKQTRPTSRRPVSNLQPATLALSAWPGIGSIPHPCALHPPPPSQRPFTACVCICLSVSQPPRRLVSAPCLSFAAATFLPRRLQSSPGFSPPAPAASNTPSGTSRQGSSYHHLQCGMMDCGQQVENLQLREALKAAQAENDRFKQQLSLYHIQGQHVLSQFHQASSPSSLDAPLPSPAQTEFQLASSSSSSLMSSAFDQPGDAQGRRNSIPRSSAAAHGHSAPAAGPNAHGVQPSSVRPSAIWMEPSSDLLNPRYDPSRPSGGRGPGLSKTRAHNR